MVEMTEGPIEMPKSVVKRRAGKFVLKDTGARELKNFFWTSIFAVGLALFGLHNLLHHRWDEYMGLALGPKILTSENGFLTVGDVALASFFLLPLLVVLCLMFKEVRWRPYCLWLDQPHLKRGGPQKITFERRFKSSQAMLGNPATVRGRIICQEVTKTTVDSDVSYSYNTLYTLPLKEVSVPASADGVRATWHIDLPTQLQHTRIDKKHWIAWQIQVVAQWGNDIEQTAKADFIVNVV